MTTNGTFQREEDYISPTNAMKAGGGGALGNEETSEILEQETIWLDIEVPEPRKVASLLESSREQSEVPGRQSTFVSR